MQLLFRKKVGETMQNRPDGSGMAFFWYCSSLCCGAVVFGSYLICGSCLAIRTDSGPFRYDEAIHRSLHKKKNIIFIAILIQFRNFLSRKDRNAKTAKLNRNQSLCDLCEKLCDLCVRYTFSIFR